MRDQARIVLFCGGPLHGEMREVDSPWFEVAILGRLSVAPLDELGPLPPSMPTFRYRLERIGVLGRVVEIMVEDRARLDEAAICSVLLSGKALSSSWAVDRATR